jgi:hypothetical protein
MKKKFSEFLTEAGNLAPSELIKHEYRLERFADMLQNEEPFETMKGPHVVLQVDAEIIAALRSGGKGIAKMQLMDKEGNKLSWGSLRKTAEFGGKGAGSGTRHEDKQLAFFQKHLEAAMDKIGSGVVPIKCCGVVHNIVRIETTFGTPKSDFHMVDEDGNEAIWISHKKGSTAKHISQWGGITEIPTKNYPEVAVFVKDMQAKFGTVMPPKTSVARKIKNKDLKMVGPYGVGYGGKLGQQNVSILVQGHIGLKGSGGVYKITGTGSVHENGAKLTGDYEPVLMVIYKGAKERKQGGIVGARFSIYTKGGRKVTEWV